jgi:hypothetical protein
MGTNLLLLAACVSIFPARPAPPTDTIAVQMRVEGTLPKPDSPLFSMNPYAKDRVPYAPLPHAFAEGELYVEVVQGKERALVVMSLGGDKKLKEQADSLVGKRVVVECRGEYKLHATKVPGMVRFGPDEPAVVASLKLTVVKITPAG